MQPLVPFGPGPYDSDLDNAFLVHYDKYIRASARRAIPRQLYSKDELDLEIDELTQSIRVKLWESHRRRLIKSPRAYIKTIAHTKSIDLVRQHKAAISIEGENDTLAAQNEGFRDPAYETEREEISAGSLMRLVDAIIALPCRQKQAVLLLIKDHAEELPSLIRALNARQIDVRTLNAPEEKSEVNLLKASLSISRKKLQPLCREIFGK